MGFSDLLLLISLGLKSTGKENRVLKGSCSSYRMGFLAHTGAQGHTARPHASHLTSGAGCRSLGPSALCFGSKDLNCHLLPCSLQCKEKKKDPEEIIRTISTYAFKNYFPLTTKEREGKKSVSHKFSS